MPLSSRHREKLQRAVEAVRIREFYEAFAEDPRAYAKPENSGLDTLLQSKFKLGGEVEAEDWIGEEISPFTGEKLDVAYPVVGTGRLISSALEAQATWKSAELEDRIEILMNSLDGIADDFHLLAEATTHTTGQSFMMAFQASGPHSLDRAMEALALSYSELSRYNAHADWRKTVGKQDIHLVKNYKAIPHGLGLSIGCSTFPVWNSIAGIYANLASGNANIHKPHPGAVLPVALVIQKIRAALMTAGQDPNLVQLAIDSSDAPRTEELATRDEIKLIDYTGGSLFGRFIEELPNKITFTEKAGVNPVLLHSSCDLQATLGNLAFAISLYSGQMCTAPQNIFIPAEGVYDAGVLVPFDEVVAGLKQAIQNISSHEKIGPGTLASLQSERTMKRLDELGSMGGKMHLAPEGFVDPHFPNARNSSPALIEVEESNMEGAKQEWFGPIAVVIKTEDFDSAISSARVLGEEKGAITCACYCIDETLMATVEEEMNKAFVQVSFNLEGYIWVNQASAFSDFHLTGANPAGNASFGKAEFVNKRFVWLGNRYFQRP